MEKGFGLIIITLILVCGSVIWVKECKSILEAKARLR